MTLDELLHQKMRKSGRYVAGRLQAALALLERLRDFPSLNLEDHLAGKGSSGLESHETFGNRAHQLLNLEILNKNHGRRSSNLQDWGEDLLQLLDDEGFESATKSRKKKIVDEFQAAIAEKLLAIINDTPITVRVRNRSVESVIEDVLSASDEKGKLGDVAQYLVGAKLSLRFPGIPVQPANVSDRKSYTDEEATTGDFVIGNTTIEIAMGMPDEKHLNQIVDVLDDRDAEIWLLTRADRVMSWKNEIEGADDADPRRVIVTSVAAFVGQNITELGKFSGPEKTEQLKELFEVYNSKWVDLVGFPGLRVVAS